MRQAYKRHSSSTARSGEPCKYGWGTVLYNFCFVGAETSMLCNVSLDWQTMKLDQDMAAVPVCMVHAREHDLLHGLGMQRLHVTML